MSNKIREIGEERVEFCTHTHTKNSAKWPNTTIQIYLYLIIILTLIGTTLLIYHFQMSSNWQSRPCAWCEPEARARWESLYGATLAFSFLCFFTAIFLSGYTWRLSNEKINKGLRKQV